MHTTRARFDWSVYGAGAPIPALEPIARPQNPLQTNHDLGGSYWPMDVKQNGDFLWQLRVAFNCHKGFMRCHGDSAHLGKVFKKSSLIVGDRELENI